MAVRTASASPAPDQDWNESGLRPNKIKQGGVDINSYRNGRSACAHTNTFAVTQMHKSAVMIRYFNLVHVQLCGHESAQRFKHLAPPQKNSSEVCQCMNARGYFYLEDVYYVQFLK